MPSSTLPQKITGPARQPEPLAPVELVERSAAVIQAAGFRLVPLAQPIGPWQLLGVCSQGLLLVSVVRDAFPEQLGLLWGHPAGWPLSTRRLIHRWPPDALLPDVLTL